MRTGGDVAEQVVRMTLDGIEVVARLGGKAALRIAAYLTAYLKGQKKTRGKTRLTNMLKNNPKLTIFSVRDKDLKQFCDEAGKYGVLFCVLKDKKAGDGKTDIMVRESDRGKVSHIISKYHLYDYGDITNLVSDIEKKLTNPEEQQKNGEQPEKAEGKENAGKDQTVITEPGMKENVDAPKEEKDPADEFIESVVRADEKKKEEAEKENPTEARTGKSRQSGRSSETRKDASSSRGKPENGPDEDRDSRKRPSVKKELEEIKKEQAAKKPTPVRENTKSKEHIAPKKKKRRRER